MKTFGVARGNQRRYARVRYGHFDDHFDEGTTAMTDIDATQECSGGGGAAGVEPRPGDDLLVLIFQAFATAFGTIPRALQEKFGLTGAGAPAGCGLTDDARWFGEVTAGVIGGSLRPDGTVDPRELERFVTGFSGIDDLPSAPVLRGLTRGLAAALNDGPMRPRLHELNGVFNAGVAAAAAAAAVSPDESDESDESDGDCDVPLQTVVLGVEPYVLVRIVREEGSCGALKVSCGGGVAMDGSGRFQAQELLRKVADSIDSNGGPMTISVTPAQGGVIVAAVIRDVLREAQEAAAEGVRRSGGEPDPGASR